MKLTKDTVEKMCVAGGLMAVRREEIGGYDVFISDGFSSQPSVVFGKFGVEPGEFTFGAYCTIWWVARGEDKFDVGRPMLFDAFHDPDMDMTTKKLARINAALKDARDFIEKRKEYAQAV